jgi:diguanylate cyclase (GGDEF)-like protein/PAS domain S-box-containing protein
LANERILIVEDEKIIGLDLQRRLEKFGYRIIDLVATGEKAVTVAAETLPDIILMDIMLAGDLDGIEAAQIIKKELRIPVVFLTAYADEKTLERAKEAEPFGYILKPFKERELHTTIDIALYKNGIDKKLYRQERWFSAILQSAGDGIIAADRDNRLRFMNPVAEILTGWKEKDAQGLGLSEILNLHDDKTLLPREIPQVPDTRSDFPLFFDAVHIVNRQGAKISIEGSVAQILEPNKDSLGQVVAFRDITDIRRMTETISYQASHDALTGLSNRDEFLAGLEAELETTVHRKTQSGLVYFDIDRFRVLNDLCGHLAGDELLRQISADIHSAFTEEPCIGRLGGDEFGILLRGAKIEEAVSIAGKIREKIERTFLWQKNSFKVSASFGIVSIDRNTKDLYEVLAAADDACFIAKEEGGNRIKVYETADHRFLKRRGEMQWISRLTTAIEQNMFTLFSQPIRPLQSDRGLQDKIEILLRLRENDGSLVPPSDFIPAAEKYNFMPAIDRWVIRECVEWCRGRNDSGSPSDAMICINLSGASIADETLSEYITGLFRRYNVPPELFCFEITETAAIENLTRAITFIRSLKKVGSTFALDDFGNGFSSFSYLKSLPVDYLKIDGSYVKGIVESGVDCALVEAVNHIGHVMGMKTIAEFVQSPEILERLVTMGVDYGQGYTIAPPAPLDYPS